MENTLFIVDDHKMLLNGLKNYLEENTQWKVPHCFSTVDETLETLKSLPEKDLPQIMIVDVQLVEETGFTIVKTISEQYKSIKCVMYSMYDTSGYILQAKDYGAAGYISKVASEEELVHCLEVVKNGGTYLEEKMIKSQKQLDSFVNLLSRKEKEVLEKILQGKTNAQISEELFISKHNVENYTSSIYLAAGVKKRDELLSKFK